MKIYQVGGAVRDQLLGRTPNDIDYVVVGSSVEEMKSLGFLQVGKDFPVFLHPDTKEEYALARKEVKTGDKHADFKFEFDKSITLQDDLRRRDFTCNAIAYDVENKEYIDYFEGVADIEKRVLRHVDAQHFAEDPLRILRMCRFSAQLNFNVDAQTVALCQTMTTDGMLTHLTAERVWNELLKALKTSAFYRFIELAREVGVLKVILPVVDSLWSVPEREIYHLEGNTGGHVLSALKYAEKDSSLVKFGILLHDIGKSQTPEDELPSHRGHENRSEKQIYDLCRCLKVPLIYKFFATMVAEQHMKFHDIPEMRPGKIYDLASAMTIKHICYVDEYIAVCRADFESTNMPNKDDERKVFEKSAKLLQLVCSVLKEIKAEDMPKFEQTPKDENFKAILREYKITVLREKLKQVEG